MPIYRVIRKIDDVEVMRYDAAQPVELLNGVEYPLADFDHEEYVEGVVPPALISAKITKLAFRNRFTQSEKISLEIAALDNPAAPMQQRSLAAMLRVHQADIQSATYVDLMRADTREGVEALERYGLIAAGRAAAILDTPPTEEEIYRG